MKVGDYLLTLPHQLELFMVQDNPALETALKAGKLQFSRGKWNVALLALR